MQQWLERALLSDRRRRSCWPSTCSWVSNSYHGTCTPGCPAGKVEVAVDSAGAGCLKGYGSFCCDPPLEDVFGGSAASQGFEAYIHGHMTSGDCPAGSLEKRQIGTPYTTDETAQLLAPIISNYRDPQMQPLIAAYDRQQQTFGPRFLKFSDLAARVNNLAAKGTQLIQAIKDMLCTSESCQDNPWLRDDTDLGLSFAVRDVNAGVSSSITRRDDGDAFQFRRRNIQNKPLRE